MRRQVDFKIDNRWVRSQRGSKNQVETHKPYGFFVEEERSASGEIEKVATIFLTNNECPFHCLMCDLWKNTTSEPVTSGAIPAQIRWALDQLPKAKTIKLYNSGNFFDVKAIPPEDYKQIAELLKNYERVIVESHPKLINRLTYSFQELLDPQLEVAMGLETAQPQVLERLNKNMTLDDFAKAVQILNQHHIPTRAFILVKPPFMNESEGIVWAQRSLDFAFDQSVQRCTVIPTRHGNGALDQIGALGLFSPPRLSSLEKVLDYGVSQYPGKVFADLWDLELFSECPSCLTKRQERLHQMNVKQTVLPEVSCSCT